MRFEPRRVGLLLSRSGLAVREEPGLGLFGLGHVALVVAEQGASRLHVVGARALEGEVDLLVSLILLKGLNLGRQPSLRFLATSSLCHLGFEFGDPLLVLCKASRIVGASCLLRSALSVRRTLACGVRRARLLRLLRLALLLRWRLTLRVECPCLLLRRP